MASSCLEKIWTQTRSYDASLPPVSSRGPRISRWKPLDQMIEAAKTILVGILRS